MVGKARPGTLYMIFTILLTFLGRIFFRSESSDLLGEYRTNSEYIHTLPFLTHALCKFKLEVCMEFMNDGLNENMIDVSNRSVLSGDEKGVHTLKFKIEAA